MNYEELVQHYGSAEKAAEVLGLTRQGVFRWKDRAIPLDQQVAYEVATGGVLLADLPPAVRQPQQSAA